MPSQELLIEDVDKQIIQIRTKSLDISFNELYDMYTDGELIIKPDYQRLFRWDEEKQSRFIESLILEMPVPPIFVIEVNDGQYELIDGLQRISSYLHFRGAKLDEKTSEPLCLNGCDIVKDLDGLTFSNLPKSLQIKIKRSFVRMEVIRKESEPALKYHMFKRLNTGGELLSAQEIRNCTIRLLNDNALNFIEECSQDSYFKSVVSKISQDDINKKYDHELVLRFFTLKNNIEEYRYPLTEYLTNFLEFMTTGAFDFEKEREIFKNTFSHISKIMGIDAFSSISKNNNIKGDFVLYYYDGISVAISELLKQLSIDIDKEAVASKITSIKFGEELANYKTGSKNSVMKRIELFKSGVEEVIG